MSVPLRFNSSWLIGNFAFERSGKTSERRQRQERFLMD